MKNLACVEISACDVIIDELPILNVPCTALINENFHFTCWIYMVSRKPIILIIIMNFSMVYNTLTMLNLSCFKKQLSLGFSTLCFYLLYFPAILSLFYLLFPYSFYSHLFSSHNTIWYNTTVSFNTICMMQHKHLQPKTTCSIVFCQSRLAGMLMATGDFYCTSIV